MYKELEVPGGLNPLQVACSQVGGWKAQLRCLEVGQILKMSFMLQRFLQGQAEPRTFPWNQPLHPVLPLV